MGCSNGQKKQSVDLPVAGNTGTATGTDTSSTVAAGNTGVGATSAAAGSPPPQDAGGPGGFASLSESPIAQGLSATAAGVLQNVETKLKSLQTQIDAICPHDDSMQTSLAAIRNNASLSDDQKQQQIAAWFAANKSQMDADRAGSQSCLKSNSSALQPIRTKMDALRSACLVSLGHGGGPGSRMAGATAGSPQETAGATAAPDTTGLTATLETSLQSSACSSALSAI